MKGQNISIAKGAIFPFDGIISIYCTLFILSLIFSSLFMKNLSPLSRIHLHTNDLFITFQFSKKDCFFNYLFSARMQNSLQKFLFIIKQKSVMSFKMRENRAETQQKHEASIVFLAKIN